MDTLRSLNLEFVTKFGKKKTFTVTGAKEGATGADIKALADFLITKKVINIKGGDEFAGLDKAYMEEKVLTPIPLDI